MGKVIHTLRVYSLARNVALATSLLCTALASAQSCTPALVPAMVGVGTPGEPVVVSALSVANDGAPIAAGSVSLSGENRPRVYLREASGWQVLAPTIRNAPVTGTIRDVVMLPNDDIIVCGYFRVGSSNELILRWDGSAWSVMQGSSFSEWIGGEVKDLAVSPDGSLFAAGSIYRGNELHGVMRWSGSSWISTGAAIAGGVYTTVVSIDFLPNGDLVMAGSFASVAGVVTDSIARFDGVNWFAMPGVNNSPATIIKQVRSLRDGRIIVVGHNGGSGGLAGGGCVSVWSGASWRNAGDFNSYAPCYPGRILPLHDGSILVNRDGSGGPSRFDGSRWSPVAIVNVPVYAMLQLPSGEILLAMNQPNSDVPLFSLQCAFPHCDSLDFNGDGLSPSDDDLVDLITVLAGGTCSTGACNDLDFNNDGIFPSDSDFTAFLHVLAGGVCR